MNNELYMAERSLIDAVEIQETVATGYAQVQLAFCAIKTTPTFASFILARLRIQVLDGPMISSVISNMIWNILC